MRSRHLLKVRRPSAQPILYFCTWSFKYNLYDFLFVYHVCKNLSLQLSIRPNFVNFCSYSDKLWTTMKLKKRFTKFWLPCSEIRRWHVEKPVTSRLIIYTNEELAKKTFLDQFSATLQNLDLSCGTLVTTLSNHQWNKIAGPREIFGQRQQHPFNYSQFSFHSR